MSGPRATCDLVTDVRGGKGSPSQASAKVDAQALANAEGRPVASVNDLGGDPTALEFAEKFNALSKEHPALAFAILDELLPSEQAERDEALAALERAGQRRRPVPLKSRPTDHGFTTAATVEDPLDVIYSARLNEATGTRSSAWAKHLLGQLANVGAEGRSGEPLAEGVDAGLAFLNGLAPADEIEAALGAQMFAMHNLAMSMARRAEGVEGFEWKKFTADQANKAARTFAAQVEALSKLRSGGKQQVEVRYIYVDARGGQNIIGSDLGGRDGNTNRKQPHVPGLAFAPGMPMWSEDQAGDALPAAGDEGAQAVQTARRDEPRRPSRSSQRKLARRGLDKRGD